MCNRFDHCALAPIPTKAHTHTFASQHLPISRCLFVCARFVFFSCLFAHAIAMPVHKFANYVNINNMIIFSLLLWHSRRRCKHLTFFNCVLGYMTHGARMCVPKEIDFFNFANIYLRLFMQNSCNRRKWPFWTIKSIYYLHRTQSMEFIRFLQLEIDSIFPRGEFFWHFHHSSVTEQALYRIHFNVVSTLNNYHLLKTSHSNMPHTLPQIFTWKSCTAIVATVRNWKRLRLLLTKRNSVYTSIRFWSCRFWWRFEMCCWLPFTVWFQWAILQL